MLVAGPPVWSEVEHNWLGMVLLRDFALVDSSMAVVFHSAQGKVLTVVDIQLNPVEKITPNC